MRAGGQPLICPACDSKDCTCVAGTLIERASQAFADAIIKGMQAEQYHSNRVSRILKTGPFEYDKRGLITWES